MSGSMSLLLVLLLGSAPAVSHSFDGASETTLVEYANSSPSSPFPGNSHTPLELANLRGGRRASELAASLSAASTNATRLGGSCAERLQMWERRNAACLVVRDDKALLVWVWYGPNPGWDLPGGGRNGDEFACETAERQTCEETGMQVRALAQVAHNVFTCEVVAENACRTPVDEGFLPSRWVAQEEVADLAFRRDSWGDKGHLLKQVLPEPPLRNASSVAEPIGANSTGGKEEATASCADRLQMWERRNAACLVVRDDKALLVWVWYGPNPGWDLPGGKRKGDEFACETAERETCEETGMQVRAIAQVAYNVFTCEVVAENACRTPVDEGFLPRTWVAQEEVADLVFRSDTWGDKGHLLTQMLPAPAAEQ